MDKNQIREVIARRAALELKDGDVVNLGIGLPTMIPDFLPEGVSVILQSENGLVGMGPTPNQERRTPTSLIQVVDILPPYPVRMLAVHWLRLRLSVAVMWT